jgi:SAM-dependent methyltransferase
MPELTTAWNEIFKREGKVFTKSHEDIPRIVQLLKDKGAKTVLDLGCGTGRHAVYFAQNGFSVSGLDNSPEGIEMARQWLADEGLLADLRLQNMAETLPYTNGFFDVVLSIQVIHHARIATIRSIIREIARVLKEGGFIFVTVPKEKHPGESRQEIEPCTFIPLDGPEKGLPHHYFTQEELREVFADFEITDVHLDRTNHYCLSAFKR